MTTRVGDLAKKYIVYKFYEDVDSEFFKKQKVKEVPVILILKQGKVVKRFEGIVDSKKIVESVKTRRQQNAPWYKLW